MADFESMDIGEELAARLVAELEPLVRCARRPRAMRPRDTASVACCARA